MKIHKEGRRILFVTLLILLALNLLMFQFNRGQDLVNRLFAGATVIVFLLILQFFRSPFRHLFTHEDLLLAPADGKVVVIEDVHESEYFDPARPVEKTAADARWAVDLAGRAIAAVGPAISTG